MATSVNLFKYDPILKSPGRIFNRQTVGHVLCRDRTTVCPRLIYLAAFEYNRSQRNVLKMSEERTQEKAAVQNRNAAVLYTSSLCSHTRLVLGSQNLTYHVQCPPIRHDQPTPSTSPTGTTQPQPTSPTNMKL